MSIDKLAIMVKNEFDNVNNKMTAEFRDVNDKMTAEFKDVNDKLDKMQNLLIRAHENRIETLEDNMRLVKTKLAIH